MHQDKSCPHAFQPSSAGFVGMFIITIVVLGCSLIIISLENAEASEQSLSENSENIRDSLMGVLNTSTTRMTTVTNEFVDTLVRLIFLQESQRILIEIQNFTSSVQFAVEEVANAWIQGDLDLTNMDRSLSFLWTLFLEFPSATDMYITSYGGGYQLYISNSVMVYGYSYTNHSPYTVAVMNHSRTICSFCGTSPNVYSSGPLHARQTAFTSSELGPYNASQRPWYTAAMTAGGQSIWTSPYVAAFHQVQADN